MHTIIRSKDYVRLFLRRYIIRSNIDREQTQILQNNYEHSNRHSIRKTWILVLFLPAAYLCMLQTRIILVNTALKQKGEDNVTNDINIINVTVDSDSAGVLRGKQMAATPSPTTPHPLQRVWDEYWKYQDQMLHLYTMKKKHLELEQRNYFTPRPDGAIEIPTTDPSSGDYKTLPVCNGGNGNLNATVNVTFDLDDLRFSWDKLYPMVERGGHYKPPDCWSRHKVAIIVPYRNRTKILETFLYNIHPFLMAQNLEYRIFVVEQYGTSKFNKGRVFNAGFKEIKKTGEWTCMVFHDVDLLPLSRKILYNCPTFPRHMSTAVVFTNGTYNNISHIPFRFGGVTSMTLEQYEKVNGHSNLYWGWGHEDYDMFCRIRLAGIPVARNSKAISKYVELPHEPGESNEHNRLLLVNAADRYKSEGLSTLEYKFLEVKVHHLFTHIVVDVDLDIKKTDNEHFSHKAPTFAKYASKDKNKWPTLPTVLNTDRYRSSIQSNITE